jgi:hypothetical protein
VPQRRALLLPLCTFVLLSSILGVRCGKGGSNSPTAPTASTPKVGAFSVSTFSASFDQTSTEHRYGLRLSVRETGSQAGGTLGVVELTFAKDGVTIGTATLDNAWPTSHLNAGAATDARSITISNSQADRQIATRVTVKVNYVDDGQKSGNVTASIDVPQPAPPPAPAVTYALSCTVQDDDTNSFLGDARVEIVSGTNAGRLTQTASNGQCSLPGLAPGAFTVRVTKSGYQNLDRGVTLGADSRFEFKLRKTTPTPTPTPPSPTPPTPTPPTPGPGEIPICTGVVPASVSCGKPTAHCNDNEWSCSQNRSGTCSSHDGVACWVCPGTLCNGLQAPAGMTFR